MVALLGVYKYAEAPKSGHTSQPTIVFFFALSMGVPRGPGVTTSGMRVSKRGKVSVRTLGFVSTDVWLQICTYMAFSPHAIFRLMMTNKQIGMAPPAWWWSAMYSRIISFQAALSHSNTLKRLRAGARQEDKRNTLKLIFSTRCSVCGCRHGHRNVGFLQRRMCHPCLVGALVTNVVLEETYGLDFCTFLEQYSAAGGFVIGLIGNVHVSLLTVSPSDLRVARQRGWLFFFLREDLRRLLGVDFAALAAHQGKRVAAARLLTACVSRTVPAACRRPRSVRPRTWMAGGPYRVTHTQQQRLRPDFDIVRVMAIQKILNASRHALSSRTLPLRPRP